MEKSRISASSLQTATGHSNGTPLIELDADVESDEHSAHDHDRYDADCITGKEDVEVVYWNNQSESVPVTKDTLGHGSDDDDWLDELVDSLRESGIDIVSERHDSSQWESQFRNSSALAPDDTTVEIGFPQEICKGKGSPRDNLMQSRDTPKIGEHCDYDDDWLTSFSTDILRLGEQKSIEVNSQSEGLSTQDTLDDGSFADLSLLESQQPDEQSDQSSLAHDIHSQTQQNQEEEEQGEQEGEDPLFRPSQMQIIDERLLTDDELFAAVQAMDSTLNTFLQDEMRNTVNETNTSESKVKEAEEALKSDVKESMMGDVDNDVAFTISLDDENDFSFTLESDTREELGQDLQDKGTRFIPEKDPLTSIAGRVLPRCSVCGAPLSKEAIIAYNVSTNMRAQASSTVAFNPCGHMAHAGCAAYALRSAASAVIDASKAGLDVTDEMIETASAASYGKMHCPECKDVCFPIRQSNSSKNALSLPFFRVYIDWTQLSHKLVENELNDTSEPLPMEAIVGLRRLAKAFDVPENLADSLGGSAEDLKIDWILESDLVQQLIEESTEQEKRIIAETDSAMQALYDVNAPIESLALNKDKLHSTKDQPPNEVATIVDIPADPMQRRRVTGRSGRKQKATAVVLGVSTKATVPPVSLPSKRGKNNEKIRGRSTNNDTSKTSKQTLIAVGSGGPIPNSKAAGECEQTSVNPKLVSDEIVEKMQSGEITNSILAGKLLKEAEGELRSIEVSRKKLSEEVNQALDSLLFVWSRLKRRPVSALSAGFYKKVLEQVTESKHSNHSLDQVAKVAFRQASNLIQVNLPKELHRFAIDCEAEKNADNNMRGKLRYQGSEGSVLQHSMDIFGETIENSSRKSLAEVHGEKQNLQGSRYKWVQPFLIGQMFAHGYAMGGASTDIGARELSSESKLPESIGRSRLRTAVGTFLLTALGLRSFVDSLPRESDTIDMASSDSQSPSTPKARSIRPVSEIDLQLARALHKRLLSPNNRLVVENDKDHESIRRMENAIEVAISSSSDDGKSKPVILKARNDAQTLSQLVSYVRELLALQTDDTSFRGSDTKEMREAKEAQLERESIERELPSLEEKLRNQTSKLDRLSGVASDEEAQLRKVKRFLTRKLLMMAQENRVECESVSPNEELSKSKHKKLYDRLKAGLDWYQKTNESNSKSGRYGRLSHYGASRLLVSNHRAPQNDHLDQKDQLESKTIRSTFASAAPLADLPLGETRPRPPPVVRRVGFSSMDGTAPSFTLSNRSMGAVVAQDIAELQSKQSAKSRNKPIWPR